MVVGLRFSGKVKAAHAELDRVCASVSGSRLVVVLKPKGGGSGSVTSAGLLRALAVRDRLPGLMVGVDCDPAGGTLTARVGLEHATATERLISLPQAVATIRWPADLSPWLDRVGRVHLVHDDGVATGEVQRLTATEWKAAFELLGRFASLRLVDTGSAVIHPSTLAALDLADHVIVACNTDPRGINNTMARLGELAELGYARLLSKSTVVMTNVSPGVHPSTFAKGRAEFERCCGHVEVVPFDRAVRGSDSGGRPNWAKLAPATELAYVRLARAVMESLTTPASTWPAGTGPAIGQPADPAAAIVSLEALITPDPSPRPEVEVIPPESSPAVPPAQQPLPSWVKRP